MHRLGDSDVGLMATIGAVGLIEAEQCTDWQVGPYPLADILASVDHRNELNGPTARPGRIHLVGPPIVIPPEARRPLEPIEHREARVFPGTDAGILGECGHGQCEQER